MAEPLSSPRGEAVYVLPTASQYPNAVISLPVSVVSPSSRRASSAGGGRSGWTSPGRPSVGPGSALTSPCTPGPAGGILASHLASHLADHMATPQYAPGPGGSATRMRSVGSHSDIYVMDPTSPGPSPRLMKARGPLPLLELGSPGAVAGGGGLGPDSSSSVTAAAAGLSPTTFSGPKSARARRALADSLALLQGNEGTLQALGATLQHQLALGSALHDSLSRQRQQAMGEASSSPRSPSVRSFPQGPATRSSAEAGSGADAHEAHEQGRDGGVISPSPTFRGMGGSVTSVGSSELAQPAVTDRQGAGQQEEEAEAAAAAARVAAAAMASAAAAAATEEKWGDLSDKVTGLLSKASQQSACISSVIDHAQKLINSRRMAASAHAAPSPVGAC